MSNNTYVSAIFKNIRSNFVRNLLISILTFVSSIVYARILGPKLYGDYTYVTWLVTTAGVVIAFGVPGTITKYLPDYFYNKDYRNANQFYRKINLFFLAWGIVIVLVMGVTSPYWVKYTGLTSNDRVILLWTASIAILSNLLTSLGTSSIQAIRSFDYYAKVNVISQLLLIGVSIWIVFTSKSVLWMVIILIITNFLQFFAYDIHVRKAIPKQEGSGQIQKFKDRRKIIKYSLSMYVNIVWQQIVWTRSEFFFLGMYSGAKQVAIYGLAYSLNSIINTIFSPIMNVLVNHFSELVSRKEEDFLKFLIFYATKYFNLFLIPLFYVTLMIYQPLLTLIYSNTYKGVMEIFPLLFFSTLFSVIMSVGNSIPFYYEKQRFIILIGLVAGIINIFLDMTLIPQQGYKGAAIANAVSQILFTFIAFVYNIKSFNIRYPIKFLVLSNIVGAVLFIPSLLFIHNLYIIILYALIAVVIFFVLLKYMKLYDETDIKNYNKVMNIIKNVRRKNEVQQ